MELPEPKGKTYSLKFDPDLTFRIERVAEALQLRPADFLKDIVADWFDKR